MRKIKSNAISLALLLLFYVPTCLAVTTQFDHLFQSDTVSNRVLLQNNLFERDTYSNIGVQLTLSDVYDVDENYIIPVGSTWTWQLYRTEDETGAAVNQLLSDYSISYQGEVDGCTDYWSNGKCGTRTKWWLWWGFPCAGEGRYKIKVLFNGGDIGESDFIPTRYTPVIHDVQFTNESIRPKLPGDNFASKYMSTIEADGTYVVTLVKGVAGNQKQCLISLPNTTVKLSNTITPGSGGHAHFSSNNELATGSYGALFPDDKVDPDTPDTYGTVIEGKTHSDGIYFAFYEAGEFGVKEAVTVEARRDATPIHPKLKSEPITKTIDIKAPDLVEMPQGVADGEFKFNNGTTCNHNPTARWVVPQMKSRLLLLDALYKNKFGHRLSFNDASVKFGGKFDNNTGTEENPKPGGRDSLCHQSHRRGNDIDVNSADENNENIRTESYLENDIPFTRLEYVTTTAIKLGLEKVVEGPIHYRYINY